MSQTSSKLTIKLAAVASAILLTAACSDQQQDSAQETWDDARNQTESLYHDTRAQLRDARESGRICLSTYEELREEWSEHTDDMDTDEADDSWREQVSEWGDELGDMFDDMGDHIDRNC